MKISKDCNQVLRAPVEGRQNVMCLWSTLMSTIEQHPGWVTLKDFQQQLQRTRHVCEQVCSLKDAHTVGPARAEPPWRAFLRKPLALRKSVVSGTFSQQHSKAQRALFREGAEGQENAPNCFLENPPDLGRSVRTQQRSREQQYVAAAASR